MFVIPWTECRLFSSKGFRCLFFYFQKMLLAFPEDSTRAFCPLRLRLSDTALFPSANVETRALTVLWIPESVDVYVPTVLWQM